MKRKIGRVGKPTPAMIIGIIALVLALTGGAIANHGHALKLGMFDQSSRDRLAGTGVIQYAQQTHTTPTGVMDFNTVHTFRVSCELDKKATSGGFKWLSTPVPDAGDFQLVDAYPDAKGYVVRIQIAPGASAENKQLAVYSNCVKSRAQRGTPPA